MAKRKRPSAQQQTRRRPYAFGVEGFGMLMLALLFDGVNIVLGILDFVVVGIVLGPIWNFIASWTVGLWLAIQTVGDLKSMQGFRELKGARRRVQRQRRVALKLITKRIIIPFVGNSVPIAKFFPFWVWQVWGALDKDPFPQPERQEEPQEAQARARQIAAAGARS